MFKEGHLTWQLLEQSDDSRFQRVYEILMNKIPDPYQDISEGKAILIDYGSTFEILTKNNPQLKLHISREQYYGSSLVSLYAKNINETIKGYIDSIVYKLFESGNSKYLVGP